MDYIKLLSFFARMYYFIFVIYIKKYLIKFEKPKTIVMKKYLLLSFVLLSICITAQGFRAGQKFADNSKMYSPSGNFYVVFQNDGNLVMINNRTGVPLSLIHI